MACGYLPYQDLSEDEVVQALNPIPSMPGQFIIEPGIAFPKDYPFRPAAVLVPLVCLDGIWHLVFTLRTDSVQDHKGQVSFPGGAVDPGDPDRAGTALREAWEEVGLNPEAVHVLGYLNDFPTVSGYVITPVVGVIPWPYSFQLSEVEVRRVFTIPLAWLADDLHWEERPFDGRGGIRRTALFYQPFEGEIVWGITARIALELTETLRKAVKPEG